MKSLKSYHEYNHYDRRPIPCPFCDEYIYGAADGMEVCSHSLSRGLLAQQDYYELQIQQLKHELEHQSFQMAVMKQYFNIEMDTLLNDNHELRQLCNDFALLKK